MNLLWSAATRLLARSLDSGERNTVLGDIAELRLSGGRAFAGMLGLVVRRQMHPWKQPRAWFVLLALVFPIATLLAVSSNRLSAQLFPSLILWSQHGTYATGVTPGAEVFGLLLEVSAIVLGSWSCGFAVRTLSHATRFVDGSLFCMTLIVAMSVPVSPFSLISFCCTAWGLLPVILALGLILAPLLYGIGRGAVGLKIDVRGLIVLATGTSVIGVLTAWIQGWGVAALENWSHAGSALTLPQLLRSEMAWAAVRGYLPAIFLVTSPALYLLINRILQRNHQPAYRS